MNVVLNWLSNDYFDDAFTLLPLAFNTLIWWY